MSKKLIIIITIVGLLIVTLGYGLFNFWNTGKLVPGGQIIKSFDVDHNTSTLVLTGSAITKVEVIAIPTGTNIQEQEHLLLGEMTLKTNDGRLQTWVLPIPKTPLSVSNILAVAYDNNGVKIDQKSLPYSGATDIYNALWLQIPFKEVKVAMNESFKFDNYTFKLISIVEDSRCPLDVQCIQAGTVVVEFIVTKKDGYREKLILSSADGKKQFGDYFISIAGVYPEKNSGQVIDQSAYEIDVYITKTP